MGAPLVIGSLVNPAGLALGKAVAADRAPAFAGAGLGAAPVWSTFCLDGAIAAAPGVEVVGDLRLRLDTSALADVEDGLAWGPVDLVDQAGEPSPWCTRGALARAEADLAAAGLAALVGHELEAVLVGPDGGPHPAPWTPYGLAPLLAVQPLVADLLAACERAGVPLEQAHAEYAPGQLEVSLPPLPPVAAADALVLVRLLLCRVARRHGLRVSLSPFPFAGGGGNGAHLHTSLTTTGGDGDQGGEPLLSGGQGPHGLRPAGHRAVSALVAALPGLAGVLTGSALSAARLRPGYWSGAHACWGLENREAAVRLVAPAAAAGGAAHVECKAVDTSANPYLATAAVLGALLGGARGEGRTPLLDPVDVDPATLDPAQAAAVGVALLPQTQAAALDALEGSAVARRVLGEPLVAAVLAVRRHEVEAFGALPLEHAAEQLRFAWSL